MQQTVRSIVNVQRHILELGLNCLVSSSCLCAKFNILNAVSVNMISVEYLSRDANSSNHHYQLHRSSISCCTIWQQMVPDATTPPRSQPVYVTPQSVLHPPWPWMTLASHPAVRQPIRNHVTIPVHSMPAQIDGKQCRLCQTTLRKGSEIAVREMKRCNSTKLQITNTRLSMQNQDWCGNKLAPYWTDGRLFTTEVSAKFKVT